MSRSILAALCVLVCVVGNDGCTKTASCKANTLFVAVSLDATSAGADALQVSVAIAGGQTFAGTAPRSSSALSGSVEIDFPAGAYPAGKSATISVTALHGTTTLGNGSAAPLVLAATCTTAQVAVRATGTPGDDMGGANPDMLVPGKVFSLRAAVDYGIGPLGGIPYSSAIGDLNGDGKNDIAVTNSSAGVAILLNQGNGTFAAPTVTQANQHPQAVGLGDLNGDGTLDVVVADSQSSDIVVYFNNGTGTITESTSYAVGMSPGNDGANAVAIRDFNGDGKLDIAVAAANGANVLLNQGGGVFPTVATPYAAGTRPAGIGASDLNGDGHLDLVVSNSGSGSVSVFLNKGDSSGTFLPAVNYTTGTAPVNLDLGDLSGDGKPDIAVANLQGTGGVTVLVNKGDGSGTFPTSFPVDANDPGPTGVAIGDIDGDHKNDLVIANNNNGLVYVVRNLGSSTFDVPRYWAAGAFAYDVHVGDLGNGHLDILATNGGSADLTVILNDGKGNLVAAADYRSGPGSVSVAVADVDKDGNLDLLLADNGGNTVTGNAAVMLGKGDGTFQPFASYAAGTRPVGIVGGDFDGDGYVDLVLANAGSTSPVVAGNVSVLLNKKNGTFAPALNYPAGTTPAALAMGDLSGDGKLDLAVANGGSNDVSVLVNNGAGVLGAPTTYAAGAAPSAIAIGDVNGDHANDVVVANSGGGTLTVLINDGTGKLITPTTLMAGMAPASVLLVDLDGDGALDIVVRDGGLANLDVLKGNGNGTFGNAVPYPLDQGYPNASVAAADLDGDGHLDLVATDANSEVSVLLGKGNGTFAARLAYAGGEGPTAVGIGDFDKDGRLDVVVTDTAYGLNGGVSLLLNSTH